MLGAGGSSGKVCWRPGGPNKGSAGALRVPVHVLLESGGPKVCSAKVWGSSGKVC